MIKVIKKYGKYPFIKSFKSIPYADYLGLMGVASVMVGNSSSGIIDAPSFHLPVVNIGTRQKGRERSTNVIDVRHNKGEIVKAIRRALHNKRFGAKVKKCRNPYGAGKAGPKIAETLSKVEITQKLIQKRIVY